MGRICTAGAARTARAGGDAAGGRRSPCPGARRHQARRSRGRVGGHGDARRRWQRRAICAPNTLSSFAPGMIDSSKFSFTAPGATPANARMATVERAFRFTPSGKVDNRRAFSVGVTSRVVAPVGRHQPGRRGSGRGRRRRRRRRRRRITSISRSAGATSRCRAAMPRSELGGTLPQALSLSPPRGARRSTPASAIAARAGRRASRSPPRKGRALLSTRSTPPSPALIDRRYSLEVGGAYSLTPRAVGHRRREVQDDAAARPIRCAATRRSISGRRSPSNRVGRSAAARRAGLATAPGGRIAGRWNRATRRGWRLPRCARDRRAAARAARSRRRSTWSRFRRPTTPRRSCRCSPPGSARSARTACRRRRRNGRRCAARFPASASISSASSSRTRRAMRSRCSTSIHCGRPAVAGRRARARRWPRRAVGPTASSRSISATSRRRAAVRSATSPRCSAARAAGLPIVGLMAVPPAEIEPAPYFRVARQAGARSWPRRAQHGHVGRL